MDKHIETLKQMRTEMERGRFSTREELDSLTAVIELAEASRWRRVDEDSPHDGPYLAKIEQKQECGNVWTYCKVIQNKFNQWQLEPGEVLIGWRKLPA